MMNHKQIAVTLGAILMLGGLLGLSLSEDDTQKVTIPESEGASTLEVKQGNNLPTSTIDKLQGSGALQKQGTQPQSRNAGSSLQAKPGADSLPKNY